MNEKPMFSVGRALAYLFSALIAASCFFPLVWMFFASFKTKVEVLATPLKVFPDNWIYDNFQKIIYDPQNPIFHAILMTFLVAGLAVVFSLAVNMMAAYVFARLDFYGKRILWAYSVITMYIPGITILITSFLVVRSLNMLDTFLVILVPGLAGGYSIFFFRQFFLNVPNELEDAARIDGCGRFRIFCTVFVPLSVTPMVVLGAGIFIAYWNSFLWPSITITNKQLQQIMPLIRSFQTEYGTEYGRIMAAGCIAVLPPIILFSFFQKYIIKGFILSGLK